MSLSFHHNCSLRNLMISSFIPLQTEHKQTASLSRSKKERTSSICCTITMVVQCLKWTGHRKGGKEFSGLTGILRKRGSTGLGHIHSVWLALDWNTFISL